MEVSPSRATTQRLCLCASSAHAQGTFPEPLESASNSFVCTRETELLRTLFNRTSSADEDRPSSRRRPQLIRFPPDVACRSAATACEQCLSRSSTSAAAVRNCSITARSNDGERPHSILPVTTLLGTQAHRSAEASTWLSGPMRSPDGYMEVYTR